MEQRRQYFPDPLCQACKPDSRNRFYQYRFITETAKRRNGDPVSKLWLVSLRRGINEKPAAKGER